MIEHHKYLPSQFTGPLLNSFAHAVEAEFMDAKTIENYLKNISINTAEEEELENIGLLIGFPRPLVPDTFTLENILILGTLPLGYDTESGLSEINSQVGGELSTIKVESGNYLALGSYRKLLKNVAYIKRYGITLKAVDAIAQSVDSNYSISFDENNDIKIVYERSIGYKNVWLLTNLFYRFATEPQVLISS